MFPIFTVTKKKKNGTSSSYLTGPTRNGLRSVLHVVLQKFVLVQMGVFGVFSNRQVTTISEGIWFDFGVTHWASFGFVLNVCGDFGFNITGDFGACKIEDFEHYFTGGFDLPSYGHGNGGKNCSACGLIVPKL